jgi:hypothetical protein
MKYPFFYILLLSFFAFESCKTSRPVMIDKPEPQNIQQITKNNTTLIWTQRQAKDNHTLLSIDSSGTIKVLAGQSPEPEFAKNIEPDSNLKIQGKIDINLLLKSQQELAKLNNQSASLMITKEALYRLAEAYFNGLVDSSKYVQLYNSILKQTTDMLASEVELEEAKAETIEAETEKLKIELQKAMIELEKLKIEKGISIEKETPEEKEETEEKPKEEK